MLELEDRCFGSIPMGSRFRMGTVPIAGTVPSERAALPEPALC
jgi:hypothetical protein